MKNYPEKKIKSVFYSIEFINGLRRALVYSLGLLYFISLGFEVKTITSLFAFSGLFLLIFEFPTGVFADYFSRKKSIIISFFIMSIGYLGIFIFKDFYLLALSWILTDIGWSFQSGTTTAWAVDALDYGKEKKKLATLFARFYFSEKVGLILGGLIGLIIVSYEYRYIWFFVFITNFFMAIFLSIAINDSNFKPKKSSDNFFKKTIKQMKISYFYTIKNKETFGIALTVIFGVFSLSIFSVLTPLILTELGLTPAKISGLNSIIGILVIISPFLGEKFSHKLGPRITLSIASLLIGIGIIIFGLSNIFILSLSSLILIRIFLDSTDAIHDSTFQHSATSDIRASLSSFISVLWAIFFSIGMFFSGILVEDLGLVSTSLISGIFMIICSIFYLLYLKPGIE
ncbi:MAG: MFS transporter [Candidatus Pacearchaeota archaeon]|jgi:MFS family permease